MLFFSQFAHEAARLKSTDVAAIDDLVEIHLGNLRVYARNDSLHCFESGWVGRYIERGHQPKYFVRRFTFLAFR